MLGGQFDVTHQIPAGSSSSRCKAAPTLKVQEAKPNFQLMYYGYKITRPMVSDDRVREAMNIAINRAEIVKGIMLGNAEPAYTFVDPKAPDFADSDQGHHQGGCRTGEEAARRGRLEGRRRRHPREGRHQAGAQGATTPRSPISRASPRRSRATCARSASTGRSAGFDSTIAPGRDGQAGLRAVDRDGAVPLGRRADEPLFRFEEHPDAQPDELEGRRDRRVAAASAAPR